MPWSESTRSDRSLSFPCAFPASSVSGLWVSRDGDDYIALPGGRERHAKDRDRVPRARAHAHEP